MLSSPSGTKFVLDSGIGHSLSNCITFGYNKKYIYYNRDIGTNKVHCCGSIYFDRDTKEGGKGEFTFYLDPNPEILREYSHDGGIRR
ncbi:MAG: hypothetical protein H7196_02465 [candidate division SR1 bacterium]|nr:hypothetical protein [candidate division SR1 bacterium]